MSTPGESGDGRLIPHPGDQPPAVLMVRRKTSRRSVAASISRANEDWGAPRSARMRHQYLSSLVQILGTIGVAAAGLGFSGNVLAANRPFGNMAPHIVRTVRGRLRFDDVVADLSVKEALSQCRLNNRNGVHVVSVRGNRGKPPAVARVIALPDTPHGAFRGAAALLLIAEIEAKSSGPNQRQLQRLFGLSPAEARVAVAVVAGKKLRTIATDFGVSLETVRTQLKMVLAKTGAKRQLNLAVMLANLQEPNHPNG